MTKFKRVFTLKSMYDGDCVQVETETGEFLRLHADQILTLINDTNRKVHLNKKRKHTYVELGEIKIPATGLPDIHSMEDDELVELRDQYLENSDNGIPVNLNDFEEIIVELEARTTG